MALIATQRTAAIAGAWSVIGLLPSEPWLERTKTASPLLNDLLFLLLFAVFLAIPMYYLVIGKGSAPLKRTWLFDSTERGRYGVVAKRLAVWFLSASATGMVMGAVWWLLSYMWSK
jgi:hypothetical protein